ncbi:helix-turn-helix domain-containing protein [Streptomyces clavuligerus]|uniref:helix-turn-helix domain-containing protein n=1 Tax=Streptomyces clavuligerus TaxID=1901 RepID=UPI00020D9449|nr:helix-turn-helix transcriptional regulator [Streptomyces clavuligerus]ANW19372.1 transcriptional regulator [Streptomyces clavuligerus]AXU13975.1 XRE family transcriptional regulator [Streptomyces clavuligerus]MBY6303950.1 helix-turn-helix transcriptional regulator [Streptomyces clavuligerus]QCS06749.1 XRE family transcriptional regulator [Streptomyces clavuligerus]QPJ93900.1 helix-turn-helix domain-containing protein [Streptomyces clavuligerus]
MNVSSNLWANLTNGERIKHLRGADLTQQGLSEASGLSYATIQKAEQDRGELSIGSLLKLAAALNTDVAVLLGQQAPRRGMGQSDRAALRQLSDAVHESALGEWEGIDDPSDVRSLARARDLAWAAYWASDTARTSALAGKVLLEGQVRYASAAGAERRELGLILASTYRVAASCANGFGQRDLALSAITSAKLLAKEAGDPVMGALLDSTLSWVHLRGAKLTRAVSVAERAALAIEPSFSRASRPQLLAYGRLMVSAAVAAARREDGGAADDYISQAHAAAARLGGDEKLYGTTFGPTAAKTEAVGIHVALKNYGRALKLADHPDMRTLPTSMSKVARNRYRLDVALAQCGAGLYDAAERTLTEVALDAPDWVRHQALPGVIAARLAKVSTARVRHLSELIGVPLIA